MTERRIIKMIVNEKNNSLIKRFVEVSGLTLNDMSMQRAVIRKNKEELMFAIDANDLAKSIKKFTDIVFEIMSLKYMTRDLNSSSEEDHFGSTYLNWATREFKNYAMSKGIKVTSGDANEMLYEECKSNLSKFDHSEKDALRTREHYVKRHGIQTYWSTINNIWVTRSSKSHGDKFIEDEILNSSINYTPPCFSEMILKFHSKRN